MKKALIISAVFMVATVLIPMLVWHIFDLQDTEYSSYFGYVIFSGLALSGGLSYFLIKRAFFGRK